MPRLERPRVAGTNRQPGSSSALGEGKPIACILSPLLQDRRGRSAATSAGTLPVATLRSLITLGSPMAKLARRTRWIWIGRIFAAVIVAGLIVWLALAGWDDAVKIASVIGGIAAVVMLIAPYVFPLPQRTSGAASGVVTVLDSGEATATNGGRANSGVEQPESGRTLRVERSGDATSEGQGSVTNTGIVQRPSQS